VSGLTFRILPPVLAVRRPQRMIERHVVAYRRQWLIVVSGFFEPLFYLLSTRAGLGDLVGSVAVGGRRVPYDAFVAPALMASSAMNGAIFDATGNVLHRLKYARIYDAALATPMGPGDVAVGEIGWALIRGQLYACSFLGVMAALEGRDHDAIGQARIERPARRLQIEIQSALVAPALQFDHPVALPHRMALHQGQPAGLREQIDQHHRFVIYR